MKRSKRTRRPSAIRRAELYVEQAQAAIRRADEAALRAAMNARARNAGNVQASTGKARARDGGGRQITR